MTTDTIKTSRQRDIETLADHWAKSLPGVEVVSDEQLSLWLKIHGDFGVVVYGIQECAKRYRRRLGLMSADHAVKFASKCMLARSAQARRTWMLRSAARAGVRL